MVFLAVLAALLHSHFAHRFIEFGEKRVSSVDRQDDTAEAVLHIVERPVFVMAKIDDVSRLRNAFESLIITFPIPL